MPPNSFSPPPRALSSLPVLPGGILCPQGAPTSLLSEGSASFILRRGHWGGGGLGGGTGRHWDYWELLEQEGGVAGARLNPLNPPPPLAAPQARSKATGELAAIKVVKMEAGEEEGGGL